MSNKTTLQNNNTKLTNNNIDLNTILNLANSLPEAGSGSGDNSELENQLLEHNFSGSYSNPRITTLGYGAFYQNTTITELDAPNVTSVGQYVCNGCTKLTTLNLPLLTTSDQYAFNNTKVPTFNFPLMTKTGSYCFGNLSATTSIILPKVTAIASTPAP
jgi:hypothetical protein